MPADAETKWFEIFKLGKYPQGDWSDPKKADALIGRYNSALHEAPLFIGHTQEDDDVTEKPSYGFVSALKRVGDRILAKARQVPQAFREAVESGRYAKRSVEIWRDFQNGGPYLRAVAFLGATIPQITDLAPVKFTGDEGAFDSFENHTRAGGGGAPGDRETGAPPQISEEPMPDEIKKLQEQLDALKAAQKLEADQFAEAKRTADATLKAKDAEIAKLNKQRHEDELERYFDKLLAEGKAAPAWKKAGVVKFMAGLSADKGEQAEVINFSEEEGQKGLSQVEWFKALLNSLPQVVSFKEIATKGAAKDQPGVSKFDAQGGKVDPERAELDAKVEKYRAEHPDKNYNEALAIVIQQPR